MRWWPPSAALAVLALGWAVGHGSTRADAWFARNVDGLAGCDPSWLLIFTDRWFPGLVLVASLAVAARRRQWRLAMAVLVCPFVTIAVNAGLKRVFERRSGPYLEYPSGHTALLVAVLGMMAVVAGGRLWALISAAVLSLLGMLGLVACGYHYLTDTIGGALLASALVCAAVLFAGGVHGGDSAPGRALAVLVMTCAAGLPVSAVSAASPDVEPGVPPVSEAAQAAGLVDVRSAIPDAMVDLRYATPNNFVGVPLYPPDARCLVHESLIPGLAVAADVLRRRGRTLVFWDCYRPHAAQVAMFETVPNPQWVARPGAYAHSHEAGRSVDVTFADPTAQCPPARRVDGGCLGDMGTDFDDFSSAALAFATREISTSAAANRSALRDAMTAGGLTAYPGEWWHFDGPGAAVDRPILDVPIS